MPRLPTPTAIRLIQGNPGKRAINRHEPQPGQASSEPPAFLTGEAREHWFRLFPIVSSMRVMTEADVDDLATLCRELATYWNCQRVLDEQGRVYEVTTKSGGVLLMPRPEVGMANAALANIIRLSDRFGLNPAYRSKVKVEPPPVDDPLEELRRRAQEAKRKRSRH